MSENIEFTYLDAEVVGNSVVVFRLSDGTMVKVRVEMERAGIATNYKNPDGSPHYAVNTGLKITIIPKDRKFTIPRSDITRVVAQPERKPSHIS